MGRFLLFFILTVFILITGCASTLPMHDPIYPTNSRDVTYSLDVSASKSIKEIELYETISSINTAGVVTSGTESLLQEWDFPDRPQTANVTFTKTGGYGANNLVQYRFLVKVKSFWFWSVSRSHDVTFAIRPYPVEDQPAPVYIQGDVDYVFDVVFIPDTDITNMTTFRRECRNMITDAVFDENFVKHWNQQFNFYINPETGTATDYDNIGTDGSHQTPANWANISFAETKVLMHQNNLRDYATGGLFSTEMQNRGTMMHESGHSMFNLADEYPGGAHWQANIFPNNWSTLAGAQADAPNRHKTTADAREMGTSGWYKICGDDCQMCVSGINLSHYDLPCCDHVEYEIVENASNP
ncbi:hypothetical protein ACFL5H_00800 [Candidatus Latescibacterota bacterium]